MAEIRSIRICLIILIGTGFVLALGWPGEPYLFRLTVAVYTGEYERFERPVEVEFDFAELLTGAGTPNDFHPNSLRVAEVDSRGDLINDFVPFQYDPSPHQGDARRGTLTFLLSGHTQEGATRRFHVYFGTHAASPPAAPSPLVRVTDGVLHKGQESFKVETEAATYYYHKEGAGFSGLIDRQGRDWISYFPEGGSAGRYRGIPNLVFRRDPERPGFFHPGYTTAQSSLLHAGPLKATIYSHSKPEYAADRWACKWKIYPHYASMTLLEKGPGNYWFLYEGTPAGKLETDRDYWVQSTGRRLPVSENWSGDLPDPEWVYFGEAGYPRVLYLMSHQGGDTPDQLWQMEGNMTVFGVGREYRCCAAYLDQVPARFTIGFSEYSEYARAAAVIDSAWREVQVTVNQPERVEP